ncbi:MAG: hypothetical protein RLZZ293_191 [Pseudomonadota bacterium]|jgi:CRISPR-associated protein Csm2
MSLIFGITVNLDKPDRDLFSASAEKFAKKFDETGVTIDNNGSSKKDKNKNTRTQLRGFYDEIVTWNDKIGSNDEKYQANEPLIRMFLAKVAYSLGRGHISSEVNQFMVECFKQINSAKSLNNFRLLFESIMGYYVQHRK